MKRITTIIAMMCLMTCMMAQKINFSVTDSNLPDVLKRIDAEAGGVHLHFIYDELDGIKVSYKFRNESPLDAVRHAIGAYPIKVTEDDGDIYVEYDKSVVKDIVLDNVTVFGTPEAVSLLNYMRRAMRFSVACPQEKVYLHFDNTGYFMGETIWFKAYVVNSATQMRSDLSHTLYVELVNPDGEVLKTQKLYIDNGEAEGSFLLESMYSTGFYEIRAYTRYMLNWGGATAFSRVMPIFKAPKAEGDYEKMEIDMYSYRKRRPSYREISEDVVDHEGKYADMDDNLLKLRRLPKGNVNVHFYPEGGNLVEGLPSRVAFTVTDSEGMHFDCTGCLVDENDNVLRGVVTMADGRGYFDYTPNGEAAYLKIAAADGKEQKFRLPEMEYEGVVVTLNTLMNDYVTANVAVSESMRRNLLGYALMHEGRIIACDTMTCKENVSIKFERKALPEGVSQLTVFDSDGRIQSDRMFFICPKDAHEDSIKITTSTKQLKPCGKVSIDIHAKPNSSISFSAMDVATLPNGKWANAKTWMLLGSDLKGYIENPEYYFESDDREHRIKADMLMMVQGWRRYDWQLMSGDADFAKIYPIEDKLYLDGNITARKKSDRIDDIRLDAWLYNRIGDVAKGTAVTDSLGHYAFEVPNSSGEWTLVFKTSKDAKPIDYNICIERNFSPQPRYISPYETEALPPVAPNLFADVTDEEYDEMDMPQLLKRNNVLPEVRVKKRKRIYDDARAAWESETIGQHRAAIYYDVDKELEKIADRGDQVPPLFEWLYARNPLFTGIGADRYIPTGQKSNIVRRNGQTRAEFAAAIDEMRREEEKVRFWNPEAQFSENSWTFETGKGKKAATQELTYSTSRKGATLYGNLDYKERPIVWIVNNNFYGVSSSKYSFNISDDAIIIGEHSMEPFPVFLDEVKSIYISEENNAYSRFISSSKLSTYNAVTIFIYTHHFNFRPDKGSRRTYFQSYNIPETFYMDDYSVLPPMEDFRRTIYWAPNVKTDSKGNAKVEFFNNSSCRRMFISTEGFDKDGHFLVQ